MNTNNTLYNKRGVCTFYIKQDLSLHNADEAAETLLHNIEVISLELSFHP